MPTTKPTETDASAIVLDNLVALNTAPPTPPLADKVPSVVRKLENAYERTRVGFLDRIESERKLGEIWQHVKTNVIPKSGLNIEQWVRKYLSFTHQYANRCAQLDAVFPSFETAHQWYTQIGVANGWRTKKTSGVDYALEVIALHRKSSKGKSPDGSGGSEKLDKPPSGTVRAQLSDSRQRESILLNALKRVYHLYRQTPEGADYIDQNLHEELTARQVDGEQGAPISPTEANEPAAEMPADSVEATTRRTRAPEDKVFSAAA